MSTIPDAPQKACSPAITALSKLMTLWRPAPYHIPPAHPVPQTSFDRLVQASATDNHGEPGDHDGDQPASDTVLYLAYGSNLCAETFLGVRGIKPLSQVNVSVPTLRLTFDLPGMPYGEPCFANVDWRKIPKNPKLPPVPKLPPTPDLPPTPPVDPPKPPPVNPPAVDLPHPPRAESKWGGELIGVVYEVTREDYSRIIQTEGGGSSYKEIAVPCIPIPPAFEVPEKPPIPELPRPFFARTLFAPYIPEDKLPDDPRAHKWWFKFITPPHRPSQDYAQASKRYLTLIRDGAREHDLPQEYQQYLHSLQSYTITTWRQRIGHLLFFGLLFPLIMVFFTFSRLFADKKGKMPPWLMMASSALFNLSWRFYDFALKPVFGDGERTEERKKTMGAVQAWRTMTYVCDEEKAHLLDREKA